MLRRVSIQLSILIGLRVVMSIWVGVWLRHHLPIRDDHMLILFINIVSLFSLLFLLLHTLHLNEILVDITIVDVVNMLWVLHINETVLRVSNWSSCDHALDCLLFRDVLYRWLN